MKFSLSKKDPLQKSKWEKLHNQDYHPSVPKIIERINEHKQKNIWLFDEWSNLLGTKLDVKEKTILEIGCGGGWFLAQMLYRGAKKVIGFEISESIINKAIDAFKSLNISNYEFYVVSSEYLNVLPLNSVDIIFENTVFQHISEEATKNYLLSSKKVLKDSGFIICQFLMNEKNPMKKPYAKNKEGIVYYTHKEITDLASNCELSIQKFSDFDWRDEHESYWRLYIFNKK